MGHPLRVVEGNVTDRPLQPFGDFTSDAVEAVATDKEFNFGALRRNVHVESDQPFTIKFNTAGGSPQTITSGVWDWTDEWVSKAFVTFTAPTNFRIRASG